MGKLKKEVLDLDGLRFMMNMLKEVRQRESGINMEINPIMDMYQVSHILGSDRPRILVLTHDWEAFLCRGGREVEAP